MTLKTAVIAAGAALLAGGAATLAVLDGSLIAGLLAGIAAVGCVGAVAVRDKPAATDPQLLQRAITQAASGRKLAIYERDTGFFAYWYLELRCMEECYRAGRYGHPMALVVVEPSPGNEEWTVQGQIAGWLRSNAREADLIAYTGNGRFVAVMPETDLTGAKKLAVRLRKALPMAEAAVSAYPDDGQTLADLLAVAVSQLAGAPRPAAGERQRADRVA